MGNGDEEPPPPTDADMPVSRAEQLRPVLEFPDGLTCPACTLPLKPRQAVMGNDKGTYIHAYCWETA